MVPVAIIKRVHGFESPIAGLGGQSVSNFHSGTRNKIIAIPVRSRKGNRVNHLVPNLPS